MKINISVRQMKIQLTALYFERKRYEKRLVELSNMEQKAGVKKEVMQIKLDLEALTDLDSQLQEQIKNKRG